MKTCLRVVGMALLALWLGCSDFDAAEQGFCERNPGRCEVIQGSVVLASAVSASCIRFEVRDASSHAVLDTQWLSRTGDTLAVTVPRGSLPQTVELAARPYQGGDCQGGQAAQTPNGFFVTGTASFVRGKTVQAEPLRLEPGKDDDGDQYVSPDSGGADCQDGNTAVNPGILEQCTGQTDLNCDGRKGCEASTCGANACVGPPVALALTVPTTPVTSDSCSSATIQVKDTRGADTRAVASIPVGLQAQPAASIAFYANATCTVPATGVTLNANEGSATFYFQGRAAGVVTVSVTSTGLASASQNVLITPGAGNRLVFTTPARTMVAGACSAVVTTQSQDALGNPAPAAALTPLSLSASPPTGFKFYADPACGTASEVTSVNMAAGQSSASFYVRSTKSGTVTVTVTAPGLTGRSQDEVINPGPPALTALSGPQAVQAGACSAAVTVALQDALGNPATATATQTVTLTADMAAVSFFASPDCTGATTSVTIPSGSGSASFYYRSTVAGAAKLTASSGALTSGSMDVTINPGPPALLAFTTAAQTLPAGSCSAAAAVQLQDAFGNVVKVAADTTVTLSSASGDTLQFFSDVTCKPSSAITKVNIPANSSSASFYFMGTLVGSATLKVAAGATNGTQPVTIKPGTATALVFPQSPLSIVAGACTQVTLQSQDAYGNPAPVSSNQTVTLTANPTTGFTFSTGNNCGTVTSTITLSMDQSSVALYVKGTVAGSVTAAASRAGFTTGTLALTVTPAAPAKIAFTSTAQTIEVNACSASTTMQVQDTFNNPSPVGATTTVTLSSSPSGTLTFYAGPGCTNPTTTITITAGASSGSFFFKDTAVENPSITAASGALTSATQQQTITPLQPTALVFTALPTPVVAGICSGTATVQAQAQGSPTTVISATPVNLAASPSTGFSFYSSTNCSGAVVTQVSIGAGQSNVSFSYKGTKAVSESITASNPSIAMPATQTVTITPAAPTKLVFTTSALQTVAGVCSAAVTIESRDPNDNVSAVTADKALTLNQAGTPADANFKFYTDPSCSTATTSITLPNGQSSVSFYYKGQVARSVDLAVSTTGLTSATQTHTVIAANASALLFSASTPPVALLAGTCALRTIESWDAFGNPTTATTTLTVTPGASGPAEFFSDAGCTVPSTQFSIAAGTNAGSFYFKAITGGINATASLTLTASSPALTSASQTETVIPTVRTGSCSIGSSSSGITCTVTPALLDMNKALLVFQATTQSQTSGQANVRCFLTATTQIKCERSQGTGTSPVNIRWSVAEFPSGVAVQHESINCLGDTTTVPLSAVVREQSFLLLSSARSGNDQGAAVPRLAELMTTTQAEIRKLSGTGCTASDNNHLQVVYYPGAAVQRGLTSLATGVTSTQVGLSPTVDLTRSILLYSSFSDGSGTKICDRLLRGELTNAGSRVTFSRGDGDTTNCAGSKFTISWEVAQFPVGTVVQQITQPLAAGVNSGTVTLATPVDPSHTIVLAGGQWASGQVHGESHYSGGEVISEGRTQAVLSSPTTLTLSRETSNDSATFTIYVVQFKP